MKDYGWIKIYITLVCLIGTTSIYASNPIVPDVGMADPHIRIFDGKPYLYATRDRDKDAKKFTMPDWHIWSSDDLVNWKHETTILPTETYMGESIRCWATDCVEKNGKYYFYFSNGNKDTGVMVGDTPTGPFKDALGKPLLPSDMLATKEYDPSVLVDDDGNAYIVFGHYRANSTHDHFWAIAKLGEDMISLAEEPKKIEIHGKGDVLKGNDKPTLHKRNGIYYLSAGSHYGISKNIYGPYKRLGNSGNSEYGLTGRAHGNYFDWNNQSFHTWCNFHLGKKVARYRESYISYLHYKENGEMVTDTDFLDAHFATGVGQYDASWDKIEAEWYMAAEGTEKRDDKEIGFSVQAGKKGAYLIFPNIDNIKENTEISFNVSSASGTIEIRETDKNGTLLGTCNLPDTNGKFQNVSCRLNNTAGKKDIYFIFSDIPNSEILLDSFKFQ